jgi:aminoglycoside phosphotransferase
VVVVKLKAARLTTAGGKKEREAHQASASAEATRRAWLSGRTVCCPPLCGLRRRTRARMSGHARHLVAAAEAGCPLLLRTLETGDAEDGHVI